MAERSPQPQQARDEDRKVYVVAISEDHHEDCEFICHSREDADWLKRVVDGIE